MSVPATNIHMANSESGMISQYIFFFAKDVKCIVYGQVAKFPVS